MALMSVSICFVLVFAVVAIGRMAFDRDAPAVVVPLPSGTVQEKLRPVSFKGQGGGTENTVFSGFSFSEYTQQLITQFCAAYPDAALVVTVRASQRATESASIAFGFLYTDDVSRRGDINQPLSARPLITAALPFRPETSVQQSETAVHTLTLSFALEPGAPLPAGFFVSAEQPLSVVRVAFDRAVLGWRASDGTAAPFFGCSPAGGDIFSNAMDFSDAARVFAGRADGVHFEFLFGADSDESSSASQSEIRIGTERFFVRHQRQAHTVSFPASVLATPFSPVAVFSGGSALFGVTLSASGADERHAVRTTPQPHTVDLGLIPGLSRHTWRQRDYEIFSWELFPDVLIFDTVNYAVQDDFFKRLAFYTEKAGYRGRLLTDAELHGMHGYNAHDYRAESLAAFFESARNERFPLNERERELCTIALENGVIVFEDGRYRAGTGAILSISQSSTPALRVRLLAHEAWHGIYFCDAAFRAAVRAVFDAYDTPSREFLLRYWVSMPTLNYDTSDDYLVYNEFMAYLLQQPLRDVAPYFVRIAGWTSMMNAAPSLAAYVRETDGADFTAMAAVLEAYVAERWRLSGGRVALVSKG